LLPTFFHHPPCRLHIESLAREVQLHGPFSAGASLYSLFQRSQRIRYRCHRPDHRPDHHRRSKGVDGPAQDLPLGVQVPTPWPHGQARSQKVTMLAHTHPSRRGTVASSHVKSAGSLPAYPDFDSCRRGITKRRRSWAADDGNLGPA
jgi:hypothetical protein